MNCSNCYNPIPSEATRCPRCGWEIGTAKLVWGHAPIQAAGFEHDIVTPNDLQPTHVPLTLRQRIVLLAPLILGSICGIGVLIPLFMYSERLLEMGVLIWIVLLAVGWIGIWGIIVMWRRLRDLWNGHTRREVRRIINLRQRYNTVGKDYLVSIDGLGSFNVNPHLFHSLHIGESYMLTYSPYSKRLWEAQSVLPQPPQGY